MSRESNAARAIEHVDDKQTYVKINGETYALGDEVTFDENEYVLKEISAMGRPGIVPREDYLEDKGQVDFILPEDLHLLSRDKKVIEAEQPDEEKKVEQPKETVRKNSLQTKLERIQLYRQKLEERPHKTTERALKNAQEFLVHAIQKRLEGVTQYQKNIDLAMTKKTGRDAIPRNQKRIDKTRRDFAQIGLTLEEAQSIVDINEPSEAIDELLGKMKQTEIAQHFVEKNIEKSLTPPDKTTLRKLRDVYLPKIQEMLDGRELTDDQRQTLEELQDKYQKLVKLNKGDLGRTFAEIRKKEVVEAKTAQSFVASNIEKSLNPPHRTSLRRIRDVYLPKINEMLTKRELTDDQRQTLEGLQDTYQKLINENKRNLKISIGEIRKQEEMQKEAQAVSAQKETIENIAEEPQTPDQPSRPTAADFEWKIDMEKPVPRSTPAQLTEKEEAAIQHEHDKEQAAAEAYSSLLERLEDKSAGDKDYAVTINADGSIPWGFLGRNKRRVEKLKQKDIIIEELIETMQRAS